MTTCNPNNYRIELTPGIPTTILVLRGTERDITIDFEPLTAAFFEGYRSVYWTVELNSSATWLRIAGKFWNEAGQVSDSNFIDLQTQQSTWKQTQALTLSANFPRGYGALPPGDYSTSININYRAIKADGSECTGTKSLSITMRVISAKRYYPTLIQAPPQSPPSGSYNPQITTGTPQDIDEPICQFNATDKVLIQPWTSEVEGDLISGLDLEILLNTQLGDNRLYGVELQNPGTPTSAMLIVSGDGWLYATFAYLFWGSHMEGLDQFSGGLGYPGAPSWNPPEKVIYDGNGLDNWGSSLYNYYIVRFYAGGLNQSPSIFSLEMWLSDQNLTSEDQTQLKAWPCLAPATPLGPEPPPPRSCESTWTPFSLTYTKGSATATVVAGDPSSTYTSGTSKTSVITLENGGLTLELDGATQYTPNGVSFLGTPAPTLEQVNTTTYNLIYSLKLDELDDAPAGQYQALIPLAWLGEGNVTCTDLFQITIVTSDPTPVGCVLNSNPAQFSATAQKDTKATFQISFNAPMGEDNSSLTLITASQWAKFNLGANTAQSGISQSGVAEFDANGLDVGSYTGTVQVSWTNKDGDGCSFDIPLLLTVSSTPVSPPPPPPAPPPPPPTTSKPRATDGTLLSLVPFQLKVHPSEIHVHADQRTGRYSGNLELGILVEPGPVQTYGTEIMETVSLRASGTGVQFFSSYGSPTEKEKALKIEILPGNWDLKPQFLYDLTNGLKITNTTKKDVPIRLFASVEQSSGGQQATARLEKTSLTVRSGTTETVLIAIEAVVKREGRETVTIVVDPEVPELETQTIGLMLNYEQNAQAPLLYQIATKQLTVQIGQPVDLQLTTANGISGVEEWEVNDPSYLLSKGLILTPHGRLRSNAVVGPSQQKMLIFTARREVAPRQRIYAAKAITLLVVN